MMQHGNHDVELKGGCGGGRSRSENVAKQCFTPRCPVNCCASTHFRENQLALGSFAQPSTLTSPDWVYLPPYSGPVISLSSPTTFDRVFGAQLNVDIMNARCKIPGRETRATTPYAPIASASRPPAPSSAGEA
ncbi:hypothetical protein LWI28_019693 [Acer negundo]|uniref:Uncharacterized protein n=1 Tax=Acer negundo TaxID=4023 RepID=A0AAD5NHT9_ACENE|nr:hypothetical protein LWI28_019693 [Acer negundo]